MGSLFRSQEMTLCQLFLHTDSAYMCISELGELGLVQFRDTVPDTSTFHRKFVNEVRRCDEMERKLRFLEKEIKKDDIPMLDTGDNPEAPAPREMIDLEATFEKLENELKEVNGNAEQLRKNYLELSELKQILRKTQTFFDEGVNVEYYLNTFDQAMNDPALTEDNVGLLGEEGLRAGGIGGQGLRLGFVAGVILRERIPAFERMLWRACRGNVFLKQAEIETALEDPNLNDKVHKSVFIIFFQGDQLRTRVKKICEGFHATLYPCPDSQAERREMAIGVMTRIEDLQTVLNQTQEHRHRVLVAAAKSIKLWFIKVRKIKAIYHILNLFNLDVTAKCMIGECWCAVDDLDKIHLALRRGTERSNSSVQPILNRMTTREDPPTYHRNDKYTAGFQAIVDSYGVAKYREINPAPFSIITFPFLFAVMFGDAGHGLLMFLFALWMVLCEKSLSAKKNGGEIWNTFFGGRYIILLMGLFSIYTGLIYNDVFSKSMNIFGSSWLPKYDQSALRKHASLTLDPGGKSRQNTTMYFGYPYPFGVDPIWQLASNKITFLNSVKMKMSIILGVGQMLFGVCLSFMNHKFYQDKLSIFCEFIPQVIFLTSIFGYLIILIFVKWISFDGASAYRAPSLLIGLINMFMFKYDEKGPLAGRSWFNGQGGLQGFLVVMAVLCIPWMLLAKPYILRRRHLMGGGSEYMLLINLDDNVYSQLENENSKYGRTENGGSVSSHHDETDTHTEEEFNFGDIVVHQAIHTIEYCLGCISNTASYLRLWALSLAHAQLSEVLWSMVMRIGFMIQGWYGFIVMSFAFSFWAVLTVGVLLIMEGLSAFLHALRLHWVEFQNKFYIGTGYEFVPFRFEHYTEVSEE